MPGAILAMNRLDGADDRAQATWIIQNLTQPVPVPRLAQQQVDDAGGLEAYMRRNGAETALNLAKDVILDIFLTRREPTGDNRYYNQLAADSGLPQAPDSVSMEDVDHMRYRDRFTGQYSARLAKLEPAALQREQVALTGDVLTALSRIIEQNDRANLLQAAMLSLLIEPKMQSLRGGLN